jgi:hypothetical protein
MGATYTYATLEISAEAYAEIAAKLRTAEYHQAFDKVDGVEVIDMHGIGLLASAPNPHAVERHLVQIKIGPDKWIDLFACDAQKEAADFMLTVCSGAAVHVRAVHLKSYATTEELA